MRAGPLLRSSQQTTALLLSEEHNGLQENLNYPAIKGDNGWLSRLFSLQHTQIGRQHTECCFSLLPPKKLSLLSITWVMCELAWQSRAR